MSRQCQIMAIEIPKFHTFSSPSPTDSWDRPCWLLFGEVKSQRQDGLDQRNWRGACRYELSVLTDNTLIRGQEKKGGNLSELRDRGRNFSET